MNRLCVICFAHPNKFAGAGLPLSYECQDCPDFNLKKYNKNLRREKHEEPQLDHQQAGLPAEEAQGKILFDSEAEPKTVSE